MKKLLLFSVTRKVRHHNFSNCNISKHTNPNKAVLLCYLTATSPGRRVHQCRFTLASTQKSKCGKGEEGQMFHKLEVIYFEFLNDAKIIIRNIQREELHLCVTWRNVVMENYMKATVTEVNTVSTSHCS